MLCTWTTALPEHLAAVCRIEPLMVPSDLQAPKIYHAIQERHMQLLLDSNSGAWAGTRAHCVSHGVGFGKLQRHSSVPALQELSEPDLAVLDLPVSGLTRHSRFTQEKENLRFGADSSYCSTFCTGLHPSPAVLFCSFLSHIIAA